MTNTFTSPELPEPVKIIVTENNNLVAAHQTTNVCTLEQCETYAKQYLEAWIVAQPVVFYEARQPNTTRWFLVHRDGIPGYKRKGYEVRKLIAVEMKE